MYEISQTNEGAWYWNDRTENCDETAWMNDVKSEHEQDIYEKADITSDTLSCSATYM